MRAQGQLSEVHAADLRFGTEEVGAFLQNVMGLNLAAEAIATLERHTEGWIAGLQLAALSLQGRADVSTFWRPSAAAIAKCSTTSPTRC
jgi:LuxR family maltose regulon positive regulatory protein